jgi:hypothetical protein
MGTVSMTDLIKANSHLSVTRAFPAEPNRPKPQKGSIANDRSSFENETGLTHQSLPQIVNPSANQLRVFYFSTQSSSFLYSSLRS